MDKYTYQPHEVEWTPEKIGRFWAYLSQSTDQYFSDQFGEHFLRLMARDVPLNKLSVLDYGCGPGSMLGHLVKRKVRSSGLEFSDESARVADERLRGNEYFAGVVAAEGLPTPLADESFDGLVCVEVVEHLADDLLAGTITEMHRVLKAGGYIALTTPHDEDLEASTVQCPDCGGIFHKFQHVQRWTVASLSAAMERAGFRTIRCQALHFSRQDTPFMRLATWTFSRVTGRRPHMLYIGRRP